MPSDRERCKRYNSWACFALEEVPAFAGGEAIGGGGETIAARSVAAAASSSSMGEGPSIANVSSAVDAAGSLLGAGRRLPDAVMEVAIGGLHTP